MGAQESLLIGWNSLSCFSGSVNRRSRGNKGSLRVTLSSIETAWSSTFFTKRKRAPIRAPANTRPGHFDGWIVLKVFCSFSSKRTGWSVGCRAFRIVKTVNLVTKTLGWLREMLSVNERSHVIHYVLTLQIFGALKKLCFRQNREEMFNWLNSANWVELHKGHVQGLRGEVTCKSHVERIAFRAYVSCPEWSSFINGRGLTLWTLWESNVDVSW